MWRSDCDSGVWMLCIVVTIGRYKPKSVASWTSSCTPAHVQGLSDRTSDGLPQTGNLFDLLAEFVACVECVLRAKITEQSNERVLRPALIGLHLCIP